MAINEQGQLVLNLEVADGVIQQQVFAFAYRPSRGDDRRVRIYTEDPMWRNMVLLNTYMADLTTANIVEKPREIVVSDAGYFALRFHHWLTPRYKRGDMLPDTDYEFGRRVFRTIGVDEALAIADSPLMLGDRRGILWRDKSPIY